MYHGRIVNGHTFQFPSPSMLPFLTIVPRRTVTDHHASPVPVINVVFVSMRAFCIGVTTVGELGATVSMVNVLIAY